MISEVKKHYVPTKRVIEIKKMCERIMDNPFAPHPVKNSQKDFISICEEVLKKREQDEFGER